MSKKAFSDARRRLQRAYSGVADLFARVANTDGASFNPVYSPAFKVRFLGSRLHIECLAKIERLRYQRQQTASRSGQNTITVVLDSSEEFRFDGDSPVPFSLVKSTVTIGYHGGEKGSLKTLLCVRYDFHNPRDAHPIFHAHIDRKVDDAKLALLNLSSVLPMPEQHGGVRIPTPSVVGPTALVQIAADHLPLDQFPSVLSKLRSDVLFVGWKCDLRSFQRGDLQKLISSSWYRPN